MEENHATCIGKEPDSVRRWLFKHFIPEVSFFFFFFFSFYNKCRWKSNESPSQPPPQIFYLCPLVCASDPRRSVWTALIIQPGVCDGLGRGGGRATHFQIMAGFCLPSPPKQAQFANSSIHLQTRHAPAAFCSLITPKLPGCTLNSCLPALICSNPPQCLSSSESSSPVFHLFF